MVRFYLLHKLDNLCVSIKPRTKQISNLEKSGLSYTLHLLHYLRTPIIPDAHIQK